jgi:hypothetical protein
VGACDVIADTVKSTGVVVAVVAAGSAKAEPTANVEIAKIGFNNLRIITSLMVSLIRKWLQRSVAFPYINDT